ncbi:cell cycle progression protein 1 isoform X2 [Pseudochaenichthys georgianus]|uniref:cell cycle progression protein 1 isoform X2 n=1 Tax=Pseudochaenichthys georgianus TaxID=52239 RepID=UPI00146E4C24|nr:cell cycle progression protein 1 isoform X2 [Pseudochaenichthys georgianus]
MSATSSDAESSCGWTIISNEGSDIEMLGAEAAELLECPPAEEEERQDEQASDSTAQCDEEQVAESLDETLKEQTIDETVCPSEDGHSSTGKQHVLSFSDHSDIVTLGDLKEDEPAEEEEEEEAANGEFYLGTSCSSQYAFSAAETVFPGQQQQQQLPAVTHSSSSEDEEGPSTVVRRRRLRKNTAGSVTEPEEEDEEDEGEVLDVRTQGKGSSILSSCILIALVVAFSAGFGHFYGSVQIKERQKPGEEIRVNELDVVMDLIQRHVREKPFKHQGQIVDFGADDLDQQEVNSLLSQVREKIQKENQELHIQQAQREELEMLLREKEQTDLMVSEQHLLTAENILLMNSLQHKEASLAALQEELNKLRDQEAMRAGADALLSENKRLLDELEGEKQLVRSFHSQRVDMMAETQTLRKKLNKQRTVTEELRRELEELRSLFPRANQEAETELQARLTELEKRLSFEQQRSDLWERLYLETKEERAKGDTEPKVKSQKGGTAGKVKETFDAVKNSTKEFVHHHKEQIKKAKEAVKENLRKFSDSVKSTFRNFKDSASTLFKNAGGFYEKRRGEKNTKEAWQHRSTQNTQQRTHHASSHNTRKSGDKVHRDGGQDSDEANFKGCSGVFDCAFQESKSLFDKAMDPIRADEFNQLLRSYLQQEVDHFHHWEELEKFINNFFHNGVFIHDRMLFTDFVSGVENYLREMLEYQGLDNDVFRDLDDFVYRHFFGKGYRKSHGPNGPFEGPDTDPKETKHQQRKQRARPRPNGERTSSRSGRGTDRHMADVKIELGPLPFDPKY